MESNKIKANYPTGEDSSSQTKFFHTQQESYSTGHTVSLNDATKQDEGIYWCHVQFSTAVNYDSAAKRLKIEGKGALYFRILTKPQIFLLISMLMFFFNKFLSSGYLL